MTQCPFCKSQAEYKTIGNHWRQSCSYPNINDFEYEMMSGLLAGDAAVKNKVIGNTSIEIKMTNRGFLDHIDNILGIKSTGVSIKRTSEEIEDSITKNSPVDSNCNFRDQYVLVTRNLPDLNVFRNWYTESGKRIPKSKDITSTMVRFWYVCDGGLSWNKETESVRAQLTSVNESDRLQKISEEIGDLCGAYPSVYDDRIMFKPSNTEQFISWLGNPEPGFEYKFEISNLDEYEEKMRNAYR